MSLNPNQKSNEQMAWSLTKLFYEKQPTSIATGDQGVDEVWNVFMNFYTKLDKHNCPVKDQKPLHSWFYDLKPVGPPTPNYQQQQQMPQLTPAKTLPQPTWKNTLSEFEAAQ